MILEAPIPSEPLIPIKPVVTQAPPVRTLPTDIPVTAIGVIGQPVGTVVNSLTLRPPIISVPSKVAVFGPNEAGTTSKQDPDNPAPVPPVGTFPKPNAIYPIGKNLAAPTSRNTQRTLGFVVASILLVWFFLGFSFRGVL